MPAGHAGLPRRDGAAVALTLCQRQLESELLLLRQEMRLGAAQHGTAPGAMQVRGPRARGPLWPGARRHLWRFR